MKYEHKTVPLSDLPKLNDYGSEGWKLQCQVSIDSKSVLVLVREVRTATRAEKKSSAFKEYLEFRSAYPKKDGTASDRFIAKYRKLTDEGQHGAIIISLPKHIAFWEKSNIAAGRPKDDMQFVPHADTWLNQRRWFDTPNDVFVPEKKKVEMNVESLMEHLKEPLRKEVRRIIDRRIAENPDAKIDAGLVERIVESLKNR